jgi:hypothetical protein
MTRTREMIAAEIKAWDCHDVRVLRDLLVEFRKCRDKNDDLLDLFTYGADIDDPPSSPILDLLSYGVDIDDLPSAPIPEWVDTIYPVWVVDVDGYALVGDLLDTVEHVNNLRADITQMMGKGEFRLVQTRTGYDDVRIEYWLGVSGNGACLRLVYPDGLVSCGPSGEGTP